MKQLLLGASGLLLMSACAETSSGVSSNAADSAVETTQTSTTEADAFDPDTFLAEVFGRSLVWCASLEFIDDISSTKTRAEINAGRITLEEVRAISAGCGKTTDYFLLQLDSNKQPIVLGRTPTADGSFVPTYKGVGGRVLF